MHFKTTHWAIHFKNIQEAASYHFAEIFNERSLQLEICHPKKENSTDFVVLLTI